MRRVDGGQSREGSVISNVTKLHPNFDLRPMLTVTKYSLIFVFSF